jgi:hypothetical protein
LQPHVNFHDSRTKYSKFYPISWIRSSKLFNYMNIVFHKLYSITLCTWNSNLTYTAKFFKWHIIFKNSKFTETCINLKYRVQNNILGVEKLKEVQKSSFLKILCRASRENARQRYIFVVRLWKAHDEDISLSCVSNWRTPMANNRLTPWLARKKYICRAPRKNARQRFFVVSFGRRTAKTDLCCAPEIKHTTKTGFPVVLVASLLWERSTAGWWLIRQTNRASGCGKSQLYHFTFLEIFDFLASLLIMP